jgi:hypothetical protein
MTVLIREEMNDADLAWAAADAALAAGTEQLRREREALNGHRPSGDGRVVEPAELRARGAL